jgi:hypothetical protein
MSRTELIIQLLKVAIGLAFGGYFVWWSLQVLDRLTPEYDGTAMVDRIFKSNPSAELRMPAMHQWPEMAEEEAFKTDNDSWRFKGETTIGLPSRTQARRSPSSESSRSCNMRSPNSSRTIRALGGDGGATVTGGGAVVAPPTGSCAAASCIGHETDATASACKKGPAIAGLPGGRNAVPKGQTIS